MKGFQFCLFLFAVSCVVCFGAGFWITEYNRRLERQLPVQTEAPVSVPESREAAVLQDQVSHVAESTAAQEYYLVCEDGFLLVFARDQETICLYTHIPITDFPMKEQERLREGIWFSDMMEVFHYLESYTS